MIAFKWRAPSAGHGIRLASIPVGDGGVPIGRTSLPERPILLWINLTSEHDEPVLARTEEHCWIHVIRDVEQIGATIDLLSPSVLCFEYDYPSEAGLAALAQTKSEYPSIPILMVTKASSERLVVWALRARVWDYMVKPFSRTDILRSAIPLFGAIHDQGTSSRCRKVILPLHDVAYRDNLKASEKAIVKAQSYILENLARNILLKEVAEHCYVSPSHLSRIFRQFGGGATFKQFVLQTRIRRAVEKLGDASASVTNVCYEVGFRDVSHFGRIFLRYVGMTPSAYRKTLNGNRVAPQGLLTARVN